MNNSPTSNEKPNNLVSLKTKGNAKEVLEAAAKDSENMLGVMIIRIDMNHGVGVLTSELSGYQVAYAKAMFNAITDKMLTGSIVIEPVIK